MTTETTPYVPQFLWKFWLSDVGPNRTDPHRLHIFTPDDSNLTETRRIPEEPTDIFRDFNFLESSQLGCDDLRAEYQQTLHEANEAFRILENEAESILSQALGALTTGSPTSLKLSSYQMSVIRKFSVFLWYRNSQRYSEALTGCGIVTPAYIKWLRARHCNTTSYASKLESFDIVRKRTVLLTFRRFLRTDRSLRSNSNAILHIEEAFLRLCKSESVEILISVASGKQQYILGRSCYTFLDEGDGDGGKFSDMFFPLTPTTALYLFGRAGDVKGGGDFITVYNEKEEDVDMRNANLFQSYPQTLYFSSLPSMALSISAFERNGEGTSTTASLYLALRVRCRQKDLKESVTKTLILKGTIAIADLTDEVRMVGDTPIAFGGFADVWKGLWSGPDHGGDETNVAVKVLRQQMMQDVKDKLVKRLKEEVLTWHRLSHPSIATLFGIIQLPVTLGMVSSWCDHGTIKHYLREVNPDADRVNLLLQVASGVSYLHDFKPTVIHGDLKGGNILIDQNGHAKITDFGVSKVIEDFSDVLKLANPTSSFAGSTRWLAPELIWAMVDDVTPRITTQSDVYAFGGVAMEVLTGLVPFPLRKHDHGVTVDLLAGQKPSHCASMICIGVPYSHASALCEMMDDCWHKDPTSRPSMNSICQYLGRFTLENSPTPSMTTSR